MIHEDNPNDVKMWKTHCSKGKMKKPRWNQLKIQTNEKGYKCISIAPKKYLLHRVNYYAHNQTWNIHDASPSNQVDHENVNNLNNHIENLRVVTNQENCFNKNVKGYCWCKRDKKWQAQIMVNGKSKLLGYFVLEEEARNAYLEAKKIYHIIPNRK
tara:strand:- start:231 stop:698 length:468 start_codon:yes stop_codon:yes gene_type:complete